MLQQHSYSGRQKGRLEDCEESEVEIVDEVKNKI
jgi:hypothetical protein